MNYIHRAQRLIIVILCCFERPELQGIKEFAKGKVCYKAESGIWGPLITY